MTGDLGQKRDSSGHSRTVSYLSLVFRRAASHSISSREYFRSFPGGVLSRVATPAT